MSEPVSDAAPTSGRQHPPRMDPAEVEAQAAAVAAAQVAHLADPNPTFRLTPGQRVALSRAARRR